MPFSVLNARVLCVELYSGKSSDVRWERMGGKLAVAFMILTALMAGVLFGTYMLKPSISPYANYEPEVELRYLYLRVFNTSVPAENNELRNVTMVSFMAVLEINNPYEDVWLAPSSIKIHIPQDVYIERNASDGSGNLTITASFSVLGGTAESVSAENLPNLTATVIKGGYGFTNDLLLDHGVTHLPPKDTSALIPPGGMAYAVVSGTLPLPEVWVRNIRTWFHGNGWIYVIAVIEGKAPSSDFSEVKGRCDVALLLKVPLRGNLNELQYGAIPAAVMSNPSETFIVFPQQT